MIALAFPIHLNSYLCFITRRLRSKNCSPWYNVWTS